RPLYRLQVARLEHQLVAALHDRDVSARAPRAPAARVALAAQPDTVRGIDAVPRPPRAAAAAVVPLAVAVRALGLIRDGAAAGACAGGLHPREAGGNGRDSDAGLRSAPEQSTARRRRVVDVTEFFEPLVERHVLPPTRSEWKLRGVPGPPLVTIPLRRGAGGADSDCGRRPPRSRFRRGR